MSRAKNHKPRCQAPRFGLSSFVVKARASKTRSIVPILGALVVGLGACKADLPDLVDQDTGVDLPCSLHADQLVAYNPDGSEGGSDLGNAALGPPDGDGVAMTTNAVLSVGFLGIGSVVDQNGEDILVHGSIDGEIAVYLGFADEEPAIAGSISSGDLSIDIDDQSSGLRAVTYVQLVSLNGTASIDAFELLQSTCP